MKDSFLLMHCMNKVDCYQDSMSNNERILHIQMLFLAAEK